MGTVAEVVIEGEPAHVAEGFRRLRSLEESWTRFRPDSELNRLHANSGRWVRVSADLLSAINWCQRMYEETEGIFDPSIRRSLEACGYDRTFRSMLDRDEPAHGCCPAPGLAGLEIDRVGRRVRLDRNTSIDLGGVGKGLAADIVAHELVNLGATSAYVSIGGDIHAAGEPPDSGAWDVPLLHPVSGDTVVVYPLAGGGLVMSTVALRRWRRGSQVLHHIIDPRTGTPADTDVLAVAVAARSAARAEALAKSAIILGARDGAAMLRRSHVRAWIMTDDDITTLEEQPHEEQPHEEQPCLP